MWFYQLHHQFSKWIQISKFLFSDEFSKIQPFTCLHMNVLSAFHRLRCSWLYLLFCTLSSQCSFPCFPLPLNLKGIGLGTLCRGEEEKKPHKTEYILDLKMILISLYSKMKAVAWFSCNKSSISDLLFWVLTLNFQLP